MESSEIVTLICAIISAIGVISVAVLPIIIKRKFDKMDKSEKIYNDELRKQRLEDFNSVITPLAMQLNSRIDQIETKIDTNTSGTVTLLRDQMKQHKDLFVERGWASASDKANWHELYRNYGNLGGNHFKEYVDQWLAEVDSLPLEPKSKAKRKINE